MKRGVKTVFGWIVRRAVMDARKELESNPDMAKGLISAFLSSAKPSGDGAGKPQISPGREEIPGSAAEPAPEGGEETTYPDTEGSGKRPDPVLDVLYEAMEDARGKGRFDKAVELARQIKKVEAGMTGGRGRQSLAAEPAPERSSAAEFDPRNLAPHADEIGKELIDAVEGLGIEVPAEWRQRGADLIAAEIRRHPDIVPRLNSKVKGILQRFAPAKAQAQQQDVFQGAGGGPASEDWNVYFRGLEQ